MHKKFCICLAALLMLSSCGQKAEEPRFVNTAMHQEFLEKGTVTGTYDYYSPVDDQGLVTGVETYTDGVLQFRSSFEYDKFGNTIRVTEEQDGIVKTAEYKNTLDEKGRVLRQEIWMDDTMTSFEEFTYDRNGNETSHHQNYWNEAEEVFNWRIYTMAYDWKGNLKQKELNWDFNDEYTVWEYENGHCIRQTSYQKETGQITQYWEYTYDEKDRCILETRYGKNGVQEAYREYVYNDDARTMISAPYHNNGILHETYDVYHYDDYGNEILQERFKDGEIYWRISYTWEPLKTAA